MALNQELREQDRLKDYLTPKLKDYIFDELSASYLQKAGVQEIMTGVPVPFHREDLASRSASTLMLASNMAFVIGCDPSFQYRDNYLAYIEKTFGKDFAKPLVSQGADYAKNEDYLSACILFRAAILVDQSFPDAVFCYGRACHDAYSSAEDREEDFVGRFKAEALKCFEQYTMMAPEDDMGYYYLGYAYLNLGLYMKTKLTFDSFLRLSEHGELRAEVAKLQEKLEEPLKIEEGTNCVLSGRFESGIEILSRYEEDERFNTWWPLWYYLGTAYRGLGDGDQAIRCFLRVLQYSPSNTEAMEQLEELYLAAGEQAKSEKYHAKIGVVRRNQEEDRELRRRERGQTLS